MEKFKVLGVDELVTVTKSSNNSTHAKIKIKSIALRSLENSSLYVTACLIMRWCVYERQIIPCLVISPHLLTCAICVFDICMFSNALKLYIIYFNSLAKITFRQTMYINIGENFTTLNVSIFACWRKRWLLSKPLLYFNRVVGKVLWSINQYDTGHVGTPYWKLGETFKPGSSLDRKSLDFITTYSHGKICKP